jgi:hypothetical protein
MRAARLGLLRRAAPCMDVAKGYGACMHACCRPPPRLAVEMQIDREVRMYAAQEQGDTAPILPSSSTHSLLPLRAPFLSLKVLSPSL